MTSSATEEAALLALRLYFPSGTRVDPTRFWHHLDAPSLARHLLLMARQAGIAQAMLLQVHSGYLPGQKRISHPHPELADPHHPHCLELIDDEATLRAFLRQHASELRKVRRVLFRCEIDTGD